MGKKVIRWIAQTILCVIVIFTIAIEMDLPMWKAVLCFLALIALYLIIQYLIIGPFTSVILWSKVRRKKLKPNTDIHFEGEEDLEGKYTIYSYPNSSIFDGDFMVYLFVMNKAYLADGVKEMIASQEPFKDNLLCFYEGPKWSKALTTFDHGQERTH